MIATLHPTEISAEKIRELSILRAEELEKESVEKKATIVQQELPNGFFFSDETLLYRPPDEDADPVIVSSKLEIIACTRDQSNQNHGRLLLFRDIDGHEHTIALPMELLAGDGLEFRKLLLNYGLYIAPYRRARQLLAQYVQSSHPMERVRCVHQMGWHQGNFILPNETIGNNYDERTILQTTSATLPDYAVSGTLEEWQDKIARFCIGNSRLVFSMSLAFATPLLHLIGIESGGFHLRGSSSTGKTTALKVAASVWGGKDYLQRWRATANGLELTASWHNDALLCLDELSQINPEEAGEAAYMLANGTGKMRSNREGTFKKHATWRLLFLSSGEIGLSEHMQLAGFKARAGQEVRVVDMRVEAGIHGIFENLHGFHNGAALSDALGRSCMESHGIASRVFLQALINQQDQAANFIKEMMDQFITRLHPGEGCGQVTRVLRRFALVAAAGELATRFKVTGWEDGEAGGMVEKCFKDWLSHRGSLIPKEVEDALTQVRLFFQRHGDSRFACWESSTDRTTINRAGFKKKDDQGSIEYYVYQEVFKNDICQGLDSSFVAKVCIQYELLLPASDGKPTRSERLPGNSKTCRCYRFTSKVLEDR